MNDNQSKKNTETSKAGSFLELLKGKLAPSAIILFVLGYAWSGFFDKTLGIQVQKILETPIKEFNEQVDRFTCGGNDARRTADALSEQAETFLLRAKNLLTAGNHSEAEKDISNAKESFARANISYAKSSECGDKDASLRLAISHCKGLGTAPDTRSALKLILKVEQEGGAGLARARDARTVCGL